MDTLAWSKPIFLTSSQLAWIVEGMAGKECVCVMCVCACACICVCVKRVTMGAEKGGHECREGWP